MSAETGLLATTGEPRQSLDSGILNDPLPTLSTSLIELLSDNEDDISDVDDDFHVQYQQCRSPILIKFSETGDG
jgi:hypothetical protein